jgi:septal ring factor EnvC (AmiA/AmiB activator)
LTCTAARIFSALNKMPKVKKRRKNQDSKELEKLCNNNNNEPQQCQESIENGWKLLNDERKALEKEKSEFLEMKSKLELERDPFSKECFPNQH